MKLGTATLAERIIRSGLAIVGILCVAVAHAQIGGPPNRSPQGGRGGAPATSDLVLAAQNNDVEKVRALLEKGSYVNSADGDGRTALIHVSISGNIEIAHLLLTHEARPELTDRSGSSALHYAAGRGNLEIVRLLLERSAPTDQQNHEGETALMLAAGGGKAAIVSALLARGADPRKRDYTGRDASDWAQDHKQNEVVEVLRRAGQN
jgi:ankyrin repeat protein